MKQEDITKYSLGSGALLFAFLISISGFKNGKPTCDNYVINVYLYLALSLIILGGLSTYIPWEKTMISPLLLFVLSLVFIIMISLQGNFQNNMTQVISSHIFWVLFILSISGTFWIYLKLPVYQDYINSTISVKIEDYASLKYFGFKKTSKPIHLDIGPGLGANALYSNYLLDSTYIPLEAHPTSYVTQRDFFRALALNSNEKVSYTDIISLENLGLEYLQIKEHIKNQFKNKSIIHTPSWHYSLIDNKSLDLITATWVLNEVNVAGIC